LQVAFILHQAKHMKGSPIMATGAKFTGTWFASNDLIMVEEKFGLIINSSASQENSFLKT